MKVGLQSKFRHWNEAENLKKNLILLAWEWVRFQLLWILSIYASYIPLKNAKTYLKVNFNTKKYDLPQKTNENKVFLIFDP